MKKITLKLPDDEARSLRVHAREAQLTVSEFVRRKLSGPQKKRSTPLLQKCRYTGAMVFAANPDYLPLKS